jgi:hypothetical protein
VITPELAARAGDKAQSVANYLVAVFATAAAVTVPIAQFFSERRRIQLREYLSIVDIKEGDDLRMMAEAYDYADRVLVFSGDFSFLRTDLRMRRVVQRLSDEDKITLVSWRANAVVSSQLELDDASGALLEHLKNRRQIRFDSGLDVKLSLVENATVLRLLYRFRRDVGAERRYKMCVLRDTEETHRLLDAIDKLTKSVVSKLQ